MESKLKGIWLCALIAGTAPSVAFAQTSVDCNAKPTVVDRLVCDNQTLLNLDTKFARAYAAAKAGGGDLKALSSRAQADLKWRQDNCRDSDCLEEWYNNITPQYQALAKNSRISTAQTRKSASSDNSLWAGELLRAYLANGIAADAKYRGKPVEIRGVVQEVGRDAGGEPYVALWADDPYRSVKLVFATAHEGMLAQLRRGESIQRRCVGLGMAFQTPILDCRFEGNLPAGNSARSRAEVSGMLAEADRLDTLCRGSAANAQATEVACSERELLMKQIRYVGWCWGHANDLGYQRKWVQCAPGD